MHVSLWNVALQMINFAVLAWLLQRFLFKPVRAVLTKRQEAVATATKSAELREHEAEQALESYRAKSEGIAHEAARAREEAVAAANTAAATIREEATKQARLIVDRAAADIERQRAAVLASLEEHAGDLAASIALRVLDDAARDDGPFLSRVMTAIDAMDASRKMALTRQLAGRGVDLVSAHALDAKTRAQFESWLAALVGHSARVAYAVDATLIAGVELRLATGVWRAHLRDDVERIRAELRREPTAA
jgi:F-type H+-transporting ATPase subunit b